MKPLTIYVVSGGQGNTGRQLVQATLAQFAGGIVSIQVIAGVRQMAQLEAVVNNAQNGDNLIVHTLVDPALRNNLNDLAQTHNVTCFDLQGALLLYLARRLEQEPKVEPGLYSRLREPYFRRIEAMEFAVDHDDGKRIEELHMAEIVLTGVSRVGKTPLSTYLSTHGWRVANVPLMHEMPPPQQLFEVDHRRVFGLMVDPGELISFRQYRRRRLGLSAKINYADPEKLYDELEYARTIFQRGRFTVIDVTDKPIEETTEEIITRITQRLGTDAMLKD
ncbi:MAG: pyruvate, phosphate dikinase/phosphoenolpyruvate synthase regulator [Anaerolineae bacterium]|nr:pyruvate, phosphate dikinase/phosphoenolpyruvate synthase regulator [Anaerolineae bacterium]